jgi:hypothetical protein
MQIKPSSKLDAKAAVFSGACFEWNARHPVLAIVLVSLVAVLINCYPVVFCGKSFVSPGKGVPMVYDEGAPLPGMKTIPTVSSHGSDNVANPIWGVPMGFLESRSLWEHGEIPLWNRYSHAGETLIGQAVSMLGDPLQFIVILGHGSAGAWDIKYLVAKFLFCVGFGLLILRLFGSPPLSLIFAALAAYCGAFFFINNHASFFVFCYAPWILLPAMAFLNLESRNYAGWGLVWLLANFACFNAGHVELSVVLIGGLNLAALASALIQSRGLAARAKAVARMAVGTLLFFGLTAPIWISFFAALNGAYSLHSEIQVRQLPPQSLLGLFDDLFFRLPLKDETFAAVAPGASLLVAVGAILSVLNWRQFKTDSFFWVNLGAIILWSGCVFGWVPASVLSAVPLLNRIGHTYTEPAFLVVMHLTIQCAYGFKSLAKSQNLRAVAIRFGGVGLVLAGFFSVYCLALPHRPVPWNYVVLVLCGAFGAPLLFALLKNRVGMVPVSGWAAIFVLGFIPQFHSGLYNFGDGNSLMIPGPRVTLNAPSPAIDAIKKDKSAPFRVVGVQRILYGDYAAAYGLEDIRTCAPLCNGELAGIIRTFPGINTHPDWVVELENPVAAHALLNLLNVKYLLTPSNVIVQEGLGFRVTDRSDFGVLENLEVWPRAFFSESVTSIASTKEFMDHLLKNGRQPFAAVTPDETAAQPKLLPLLTNSTLAVAPATNYRLLPNSTAFDIHADSAGVVCLTETQAKDFTATANGAPKNIFTINRAFKGIYLDKPGDYRIQFTYRPRHWRLACALFWASAALAIALASAVFIFGKFKKVEPQPVPDIPLP